MTCRGFQYELGKTYKMDEDPIICQRGFHACIIPGNVFMFYPDYKELFYPNYKDHPAYYFYENDPNVYANVYAKVYLEDPIWGDLGITKICANNIRIGEKLLTADEIYEETINFTLRAYKAGFVVGNGISPRRKEGAPYDFTLKQLYESVMAVKEDEI
jgi:hypothetical protein